MSPRIKIGLIVGAISLVLTTGMSLLVGLCGPVVSLVAGALAGYFTVKQESPASKSDGGKIGAIAGVITGAMGLIGQLIGSILALTIMPSLMKLVGNTTFLNPSSAGEPGYWLGGLGTGFCIGLGGIVFSVLAGLGAGYISAQDKPAVAPPAETGIQ
jgi:hypothetical protein